MFQQEILEFFLYDLNDLYKFYKKYDEFKSINRIMNAEL